MTPPDLWLIPVVVGVYVGISALIALKVYYYRKDKQQSQTEVKQ